MGEVNGRKRNTRLVLVIAFTLLALLGSTLTHGVSSREDTKVESKNSVFDGAGIMADIFSIRDTLQKKVESLSMFEEEFSKALKADFDAFFNRNSTSASSDNNPNVKYRTLEEKVINAGFRVETHKIVTEDRYILTAFRIPGKLGESPSIRKKPATLTHALLDDSYSWIMLNNTNNLVVKLAEEGYDVWLFNIRGNMFSYEHMDRDTHDSSNLFSKYWDFTWDEMIKYDLKANINYVKGVTGFDKILYFGHSQGTFIFHLGYTLYPELLESSIERYIGIGPMFTLKSSTSPYLKFFNYSHILDILFKFNYGNLLVLNPFVQSSIHNICGALRNVCFFFVQTVVSIHTNNRMNSQKLTDLFYFEPGGTSTKNLLHWIQLYRTGKHTLFDYGKAGNKEHYGQETAPEYDLTKYKNYKIKTLLTYSDNDSFSYPKDLDELVNLVEDKSVIQIKRLTNYNHLDYLWSDDAVVDLYPDIFSFIRNGREEKQKKKKNLRQLIE